MDFFAQPTFRADVEAVADDQHTDQQLRIERPSRLTVKGYQVCPNSIELNEAINLAQQMRLRHMPSERKLVEHGDRVGIITAIASDKKRD